MKAKKSIHEKPAPEKYSSVWLNNQVLNEAANVLSTWPIECCHNHPGQNDITQMTKIVFFCKRILLNSYGFLKILSPILLFAYSNKISAPYDYLVESSSLLSQGVTAVVHGFLFMHWATIRQRSMMNWWAPPQRGSACKEIHQTSYLNTSLYSPQMVQMLSLYEGRNLPVMAIQQCTFNASTTPSKDPATTWQ